MYRRPKFLEILLEIRREMALEADYDVDLFAEFTRSGKRSLKAKKYRIDDQLAKASPESANDSKSERTR